MCNGTASQQSCFAVLELLPGSQQVCYSETSSLEGKLVLSVVPVTFEKKELLNSSNSSGVNLILVPAFLIGVPLRNAASVSAEKLTHKVTQEMAC